MMTRCNVRFLGVLLTFVPCVPVLMAATEERVDQTFTATPGMTLKVEVDFGAIEVVTNATSQIVVSAYRKVTAGTVAKEKAFLAERPVVMKQAGSELEVKAVKPGAITGWNWSRIKTEGLYKISVPADCSVNLDTAGGHIHVTGLAAPVVADTSGGGLKFTGVRADIRGETSGGTILVVDCTGKIDIDTSGGRIEVKGGGGTLDADTSGGSIRVAQFAGPAVVETSGGSITLEGIAGRIVGNTSGGSIQAIVPGATLPGSVDLSTSGGSVSLTAPPDAAFTLDAASSGGGVRSELPVETSGKPKRTELSGPVNGGGETVRLRTSGGSILVKRGVASVR